MSTHVISLTRDLETVAQEEAVKVRLITSDYIKEVVIAHLKKIKDGRVPA